MAENQLQQDLKKVIRGDVSTSETTLDAHSHDASIFSKRPKVVVYPKTGEDVGRLVNYINLANEEKVKVGDEKLHLTARARGTDMTGGPLSDSVVVNVDKYFNKVKVDEDNLQATIGSGVEFTLFEQQTLPSHLTMPAYPSSKQYAAFGGMIMNDCAGEKTLRYGKMHQYVDWIDLVLSDGTIARFEELTRDQVNQKMTGKGQEASIYRQLIPLIEKHQTLIQAHRPPVSKNSSGYGLWRVWNQKKDTFNLSQLLVGSQGTLGIMDQAGIKLVHEKPHRVLLTVFITDWQQLPEVVNTVLPHDPEMLEAYDDNTLEVAMKYRKALAKEIGVSSFKLWRLFREERKYRRAHNKLPPLTLLIELAEDQIVTLNNKIGAVQETLTKKNLIYKMISDPDEHEKFWGIRRLSYKLLKENTPGITATVFIEDFCVTPENLPSFFPKMLRVLQEHKIKATIAGHAGNGNFHIIPLMDLSAPEERAKIIPVMERIHALIWEHGGSISAEHNDGILRTPFVEEQFGTDMYKLFREIKRIFDPGNIFNPGKKVGGSIRDIENSMLTNNPRQKTEEIYA